MKKTTIKKRTQCEKIEEHLRKRGTITAVEALITYRCFRLAARIKDLRDKGLNIVTDIKRDEGGAAYGSYRIV